MEAGEENLEDWRSFYAWKRANRGGSCGSLVVEIMLGRESSQHDCTPLAVIRAGSSPEAQRNEANSVTGRPAFF